MSEQSMSKEEIVRRLKILTKDMMELTRKPNEEQNVTNVKNMFCEFLDVSGISPAINNYMSGTQFDSGVLFDALIPIISVNSSDDNNTSKPLPTDSIFSRLEYNGRYEKSFETIVQIGRGGYGAVYKVRDKLDDRIYAVKQIKVEGFDEKFTKYVLNEVKVMAKLNSNYIVDYNTAWIEKSIGICIQMEFCSHNLKDIIELKAKAFERKPNEVMNRIEFFISTEILKELFECVKYLHELKPPIIHRDLKPENILIQSNRSTGRFLKICDFGLTTYQGKEDKSLTRAVGTEKYLAPEVRIGTKYDTRADVYSLGIISSQVLDLDLFNSESRKPINKDLESKLKSLEDTIGLMCAITKWRPTCADVLDKSNIWSIDSQVIKESEEINPLMNKLKENYEFIYNYLNQKIN